MAKKLLKRVAKTTGTTVGEAQGIMRNVRTLVRAGKTAKAENVLTNALAGGPRKGVPASEKRSLKARRAGIKITSRIADRQAQSRRRVSGKKV